MLNREVIPSTVLNRKVIPSTEVEEEGHPAQRLRKRDTQHRCDKEGYPPQV